MIAWAVAISVFGVVLELCGVFLAVMEIRDRAGKLREYERRLLSVSAIVDERYNIHGSAAGIVSEHRAADP